MERQVQDDERKKLRRIGEGERVDQKMGIGGEVGEGGKAKEEK
jgi:hypothetical protein